jgi:Lrp/AsnC family transcriptional regulator for asnA, asnC and gidA
MRSTIDDLDLAILEQLQDDGRLSLREIGKLLGVAPATVRARFQQLIADEVIEIVAVPNPAKLRIGFHAVVTVHHVPGVAHALALELASQSEIAWVGLHVAGCAIICEVVAADADDFLRYREEVLGKLPGITDFDVALLVDVLKMRYRLGRPSKLTSDKSRRGRSARSTPRNIRRRQDVLPDRLDLAILEELENDGRRPFAQIGTKLGVATATVRSRIQRLVDADMVQIVAVPDPHKVGIGFIATVALQIEPGHATQAANLLCERDEVCWVGLTVSHSDVITTIWLKDRHQYLPYRDEVLATLPGFRDITPYMIADISKVHYHLPTLLPQSSNGAT